MRLWRRGCATRWAGPGLALLLFWGWSSAAGAGGVTVFPGGSYHRLEVRSLRELRFDGAVAQRYDFSCGAAAIATLLTHHYGAPTAETQVFQYMWDKGDQEKIRKVGFSLLDMRDYLRSRGYQSDGFDVSLEQLRETGVPAIILIEPEGYKHFVVIKGINHEEVLVGDPALGVRVIPMDEFEAIRDTVVLVIRSHVDLGRKRFNDEDDWSVRPRPPVDVAIDRNGLGTYQMNLPRSNEF